MDRIVSPKADYSNNPVSFPLTLCSAVVLFRTRHLRGPIPWLRLPDIPDIIASMH
jgi:hypothetical protein